MANVPCRQGILRYKTTGGNPTFLERSGNYIKLNANVAEPTEFVIAHGDHDYLCTEYVTVNQAWGPFNAGHDYYLYWDIPFTGDNPGMIERGYTLYDPYLYATAGQVPRPIHDDQHYFDSSEMVMKYYHRKSSHSGWWIDVVRVFAAKYDGSAVITPYPIGSQVSLNGDYTAGEILFDEENQPLQRWQRDRKGYFATTDTPLSANWNRLMNYKLDSAIAPATAGESIPRHYCVAWSGINPQEIRLARQTDVGHPAIGIAAEDMNTGEFRPYIPEGWVMDAGWEWTEDPGTPLWVGPTGQLTTTIPQLVAVQRMGTIVDRHTVFINPWPQYVYG